MLPHADLNTFFLDVCLCRWISYHFLSLSLRYGTMQMRKKSGSRSDSFVFIYRRKSVGVDLNILAVRFFQKRKKKF